MNAAPTRPAWQALLAHHAQLGGKHLRELLAEVPERGTRWTASAPGLYLDYSKNRIDGTTVTLLTSLARQSSLPERIAAMVFGERTNTTERRAP